MTQKSELGKQGENTACVYLKKKRFRILERNVRKKWGELDIVARAPDKTLVFVEVKTMRDYGDTGLKPEDQMTREKLKKFKRAASLYAGSHQDLIDDKKGWRLDMIALMVSRIELLTKSGNSFSIKHYTNVV